MKPEEYSGVENTIIPAKVTRAQAVLCQGPTAALALSRIMVTVGMCADKGKFECKYYDALTEYEVEFALHRLHKAGYETRRHEGEGLMQNYLHISWEKAE